MSKTDKQAFALMSFFATLMLASVLLPAEAAISKSSSPQINSLTKHMPWPTEQCTIGSDISILLNLP